MPQVSSQPDELDLQVRLAGPSDVPQLVALLDLLFQQESEFQPSKDAQSQGLHQILSDPSIGEILVLCVGEQVYGMVNLLYTISTALGSRVALLEDMVVHPEVRSRGWGQQLLRAAIAHATAAGCARITLLTDRTNHGAQQFYKRAGFHESEMIPFRWQPD